MYKLYNKDILFYFIRVKLNSNLNRIGEIHLQVLSFIMLILLPYNV